LRQGLLPSRRGTAEPGRASERGAESQAGAGDTVGKTWGKNQWSFGISSLTTLEGCPSRDLFQWFVDLTSIYFSHEVKGHLESWGPGGVN